MKPKQGETVYLSDNVSIYQSLLFPGHILLEDTTNSVVLVPEEQAALLKYLKTHLEES